MPRMRLGQYWFCTALIALTTITLKAADADLILTNGHVITVDHNSTIQRAVAIKNGKIVAVGSDGTVTYNERGPRTKVVDLRGKTVLPALVDAHVHAL